MQKSWRPVFQTTFGYPTGNCFNAAVASVLSLDSIPEIDPAMDEDEWVAAYCRFFDRLGVQWQSTTSEPEYSNWERFPHGIAIAHIEVAPGILHAVVCDNGKPVHDVMPGSPFLRLGPERQRNCRILSWTSFRQQCSGERNGFAGIPPTDHVPAPRGGVF
jgi:hypothetical protein